ncbi:MAG: hypothetical protein AAFW73_26280 [Bacteroidota bacterium]
MHKYLYPNVPGQTRIYNHTFEVPINPNQNEFKLEEKSAIEHERILGVWVASPGGTGINGSSMISQAVFDAAYISLREDETIVAKNIPLRRIKQCNDNGLPFFVDMNKVDMVESSIKIGGINDIADADLSDRVIQFTFDFIKLSKRK